MSTEYIHYGSNELHRVDPIRNQDYFTKPFGGIWASPVNAKFGWIDWCKRENFRTYKDDDYFKFTLKDNAKIIHIYSVKDLENLPKQRNSIHTFCCLDYEKLEQSYDGIELHLSDEVIETPEDFLNGLYFELYGWDCDSILIFNDRVIEII